jgi:7-carboxy-7-deazaguanine synthase
MSYSRWEFPPQPIRLNDIYQCVQGEGCQTGVAMVMVRLQGCGVGCPFCDTKETWALAEANKVATLEQALGTNPKWCEVEPGELAAYARWTFPGPRWALVSGGEPADQPLFSLVRELHGRDFRVALETSGTARGHVGAGFDWICVSPKIGMPGGKAILPEAVAAAHEIKHVVGKPEDIEALDQLLLSTPLRHDVQICLQPVSTQAKATELCTRTAIDRGWRLSLQTHKLVGLR